MREIKGKEYRFLVAYLKTGSRKQARQMAKVSDRQAGRYLTDEVFKATMKEYQNRALEKVVFDLQSAGGKAVQTLLTILDDEEAGATAKVSASRSILEYMFKGVETVDFADRLEHLEGVTADEEETETVENIKELIQSLD